MRIFLILITFIHFQINLSQQLLAQTGPAKQWDKTFGGSGYDNLRTLQQTSDGGYIMGGDSDSPMVGDKTQASKGWADYWVIKLDASGNKIWDKAFGGSGNEILYSLQQTSDGGFILGGYSDSPISGDKTQASKGGFDYWVVKLDANGNKVWDKTYGGNDSDFLYTLKQTTDGGYILGGETYSGLSGDKTQASNGREDYWVVKLDANGNKQWDKTFGGNIDDLLFSLQQTSDGGYILGGHSNSGISGDKSQASRGFQDYWVIKLDASGNKIWDRTFGGSNNDLLTSLQQTSDGGYILGGESFSALSGDKSQNLIGGIYSDFWIVKLNANGNKLWDKTIGGTHLDALQSLQQTSDGGFILGGFSESGISGDKSQPIIGSYDYWIVKLNANGNKTWDKTYGGIGTDRLISLRQTSDGGYILGGFSFSGLSGDKTQASQGGYDYWVVKVGPNCSDLTATLTASCSSGGTDIHVNIAGLQSTTTGTPSSTLNYTVNGVSQTATGTSPTFTLQQNAVAGTVYSLTSISAGLCTNNLTNSFTVDPIPGAPSVTQGSNCGPGSITLSATGAPAGGSYNWYGVSSGGTALNNDLSGVFNTPNINVTTTYYVAAANNAGCEGSRVPVVATIIPLPVVNAGSNAVLCESSAPLQLSGFSPAGGTWSGPGVNAAGLFTPNPSLIGTQTLTYSIVQNGCSASSTKTITVVAPPIVNAGTSETICANASPFQLTGFTPAGGTWSGAGVSASGVFTPNNNLVGSQTLSYSFTQNGCTETSTKTIIVNSLPVVSAGAKDSVCSNANPIQLTGASPAGGIWSGPGVSPSGLFTPTGNLTGNQTLTYTVTQNGCTASETKQVDVIAAPTQPVVNLIAPDTLISSIIGNSYEWKLNGSTLPNTTRKLKASANGLYSVQVKTFNNCNSTFSPDYNFIINGSKGSLGNDLKLYPNPTSGIINLELDNSQPSQVIVYNSLGQRVLTKSQAKIVKKENIQLDLSKEAKGVYTIQVLSDNKIITRKVVLQ